ncbi:MAG: alpha-glucosidase/alpha-galactosidase [Lachnospiraceae bacterium]|nr:alpha-glucosidase/alpha-galactosidase [Lachnospiraceae bacterium]
MRYCNNRAEDVKIAYIGGGSRGWAWNLMSDLALEQSLSGTVYLYDIDYHAAKNNELIGNKIPKYYPEYDNFTYKATETAAEALQDADFVVLSILPGTFDEMESDVHAPEKYGIYQAVGDTVGLGGIIRGLRTLPIYEEYALLIKKYCPNAWVINYTNPMTTCVDILYKTFPEIKAVGCCHEVFGTQDVLITALEELRGITGLTRDDIKVNVIGINHFTWLTEAKYKNIDIFPVYKEFCEKYKTTGHGKEKEAENWMNRFFKGNQRVKFDLFLRYGAIAAAGDRHLAEFCPGSWYMKNPESVAEWGFSLTPVSWRKDRTKELMAQSERMASGEERFEITPSGEKGVAQMKALLGLEDLITNVNLPNRGQIPNLPLGAVVETNAVFTADSVTPVFAGEIPAPILGLTSRTVENQQLVVKAVIDKDLKPAFSAFINEVSNHLDLEDSKKLFNEMIENTKEYLGMYQF